MSGSTILLIFPANPANRNSTFLLALPVEYIPGFSSVEIHFPFVFWYPKN